MKFGVRNSKNSEILELETPILHIHQLIIAYWTVQFR